MRVESLFAAAALASFAGPACAGGAPDFPLLFQMVGYAAAFLLLSFGQAIYLLCLPRARWFMKIAWIFALAAIHAIAAFVVLWIFIQTKLGRGESLLGFVMVMIPGFIFIRALARWYRAAATEKTPE